MNYRNWIDRGVLLLTFLVMVLGIVVCCSCTRTVYVPVKEVQTVFQNHTDTVHRTDSIIKEKETIVMQLDSTAMAQYGIRLSNAEKAWLIREKQLESKINMLLEKKADTLIVRDTIPQPYPVKQELNLWQKTYMSIGKVSLWIWGGILIAILAYIIIRRRRT